MPTIASLKMFIQVADNASFSKAAATLSTVRATASKHISDLESELGVRLFDRTTRRVYLTEAGEAYLSRARRALDVLREAGDEVAEYGEQPKGHLRISVPVNFATLFMAPIISKFREQNPGVSIEITTNRYFTNTIAERFDVALRIGILKDSSLIARKISKINRVLCASPSYLAQNGSPETIDQLVKFECIPCSRTIESVKWILRRPNVSESKFETLMPSAATRSDNLILLVGLAKAGQGIINVPKFMVHRELLSGELVRLMPDHEVQPSSLFAVFPPGNHNPEKVRRFVDFMVNIFQKNKLWEGVF